MSLLGRSSAALALILLVSASAWAGPKKASKADLKKGKQLFVTNCAACHGEKGDGNGPASAALTPKPRNFLDGSWLANTSVEVLFESITNGIPGSAMASFASLPEADRRAIAAFVKSLKR